MPQQVFVRSFKRKYGMAMGITNGFFRARQFQPGECQPRSFRLIPKGGIPTGKHGRVLCRKKGETKLSVQSVLHPRTELERKKLGIPKRVLEAADRRLEE